jgi:hypothetical protein
MLTRALNLFTKLLVVSKKTALLVIALFLVFTLALPAFADSDYQQGMGLLEVFKTDSPDMIPHLEPALKVPWMHGLACKPPDSGDNIWLIRNGYQDTFLVPECAYSLGARPGSEYSLPYVAQITFSFEAKEPGKYTFTVWHGRNDFVLTAGDFLVANISPGQPNANGICEFKKGLQPAVIWLTSNMYSGGNSKNDPYFEVKVLAPNSPAAVPVARDMLFVKSMSLPGPWRTGGHSREMFDAE